MESVKRKTKSFRQSKTKNYETFEDCSVVRFIASNVVHMKPSTKNIVYKLLYKFGNYGKNLKMSGDRV